MNTTEIKQKLHHYIETAQGEKLKALYAMVEGEIEETYNFWDDEGFVAELKRREEEYTEGSVTGFTLEESVTRAKQAVSRVK